MLVNAKKLLDYSLGAVDGELGKVRDFYFDDHSWAIRYLVVETGNWLFGREVLVSPEAIIPGLPEGERIPVRLTKDQIRKSPDIDANMPVSRQQEAALHDHYAWPSYGGAGMGYPTTGMVKGAAALNNRQADKDNYDPHLRSFKHISKYEVHNAEGMVGRTSDIFIDLETWSIPFLLLDDMLTTDQEMVVIPAEKITAINWDNFQVQISMSNAEVKNTMRINSPGFLAPDSDQFIQSD